MMKALTPQHLRFLYAAHWWLIARVYPSNALDRRPQGGWPRLAFEALGFILRTEYALACALRLRSR